MAKSKVTSKKVKSTKQPEGKHSLTPPPYPPPMMIPLTIGNSKKIKKENLLNNLHIKKYLVDTIVFIYQVAEKIKTLMVRFVSTLNFGIRILIRSTILYVDFLSKKQSRIFTFVGGLLIVLGLLFLPIIGYPYLLLALMCATVQLIIARLYKVKGY